MATQYLPFATVAAANSQSQTDWAQKILKHPTLSTSTTKAFYGVLQNFTDGTAYGIFSDDVLATCQEKYTAQQFTDLQAALIPDTDQRIVDALATQPKPPGA